MDLLNLFTVMLKLSEPADLSYDSNVRKICLPFIAFNYPQSSHENNVNNGDLNFNYDLIPERDNNLLRSIKLKNLTRVYNKFADTENVPADDEEKVAKPIKRSKKMHRRRNDKFLHAEKYFNGNQRDVNIQVT